MEILAFILTLCAVAATGADWLQTLVIARHPETWREINPILGEHPSTKRAHVYFAVCCTLEIVLAIGMSAEGYVSLLCLLAAATTVFEAYWVRHNWRFGIRL